MMVVYSCGHEAPLQVNDGLLAPSGGRQLQVEYPCKACVVEAVRTRKQHARATPRLARRYWTDADGIIHVDWDGSAGPDQSDL